MRIALKTWDRVHTWSSLVCTVFLLVLCVTGLPLVFGDEIGQWTGTAVAPPVLDSQQGPASLDTIVAAARTLQPGTAVKFLTRDDDAPAWFVAMARPGAKTADPLVWKFDARTGKLIQHVPADGGWMAWVRQLHTEWFVGLPGTMFIGVIGLCFVVAIVSGVALYAPFMRNLDFGQVRTRSSRLKWLDLHNLFGIVVTAWMLVVGLTGIVNALEAPLVQHWESTELVAMIKGAHAGAASSQAPAAIDVVARAAEGAAPGMSVAFIAFPGTPFTSSRHYMVLLRGASPLTSKLLKPVLVDAGTGQAAASRDLPWYLTGLLLAQPLHFGDYGGLPLKFIWALLDLATILVAISGLYLWFARRRARR